MINSISLIEAIYVVYMLRFFRTTKSFAIDNNFISNLLSGDLSDYIKHNTNSSGNPISQICRFGKDASILIAIYLILRAIILKRNLKWNWNINKIIVLIIFIISLINMNAVIYLLPFYITEYLIIYHRSIFI